MPYGEFIIDAHIREGQDAVLVAGGTGISPFLPYIETLALAGGKTGKVALYYGARQCSNVISPELLARCAASVGSFDACVFIENEAPIGLRIPGVGLRKGRLSIDAIHSETRGLRDPVFFLSGPPAMILHFKQSLVDRGVALDNIKIDEWE